MNMDSEKNKNNTLFEDLTVGSSGYVGGMGKGQGQSGMVHKPAKVTLLDLISQAKDWESQMDKAPNRLPYPLQDGLCEQLGDLYVAAEEIKRKVAQSAKNSIIKDNTTALEAVKKIHKKMSVIGAAIQQVVNDLDGLGVGTSTPEFHA